MRVHWLVLLALPLLAARCGPTDPSPTHEVTPPSAPSLSLGDAKVQRSFAAAALEELKSRKNWTRAYALLSESGMKDRGQHLIIEDDQKRLNYRWWDNAVLAEAKERPLSDAESATVLRAFSEAKTLTDLEEPSFDGITFEYWVLRRDGDSIVPEQRVYMKNPSTANDARYDVLAMTFLNLKH